MYNDGGHLRISGLRTDDDLKTIEPLITVSEDEKIKRLFEQKLSVFYNQSKESKEEECLTFELDWESYYKDSLEKKGVFKKYTSTKNTIQKATGTNLFEMLSTL